MVTAQQVKQSLSIVDSMLLLAAKKKLTVVDIAVEDLQTLVGENKRLKQLITDVGLKLEWGADVQAAKMMIRKTLQEHTTSISIGGD